MGLGAAGGTSCRQSLYHNLMRGIYNFAWVQWGRLVRDKCSLQSASGPTTMFSGLPPLPHSSSPPLSQAPFLPTLAGKEGCAEACAAMFLASERLLALHPSQTPRLHTARRVGCEQCFLQSHFPVEKRPIRNRSFDRSSSPSIENNSLFQIGT